MAYTTINKSGDYFGTKLWTGNETDNRDIAGFNFQPDFAWIKARNNNYGHSVFDAVRGVNKYLTTNATNAEIDQPSSGYISQFNSDGYRLKHGSSTFRNVNDSDANTTYASWNWKANGAGSANTAGSINSTATSANTTAGFSIVKYTGNQTAGATVGHGLGSVPKMIIVKNLNDSENWVVYHNKLGNTDGLYLNTTDSTVGTNTFWNNTTPTTTLFTLGNNDRVNNVNIPYIAYCFAEKKGYSKFGSYTGNGNADGSFIYTGFKPAFVIVKCSSHAGESWWIGDNKRPGYNVNQKALLAESSAAESDESYQAVDFLSNGIKWRGTNDRVNASGKTYIYMAFAEAPLVGTNGGTAKAR